MDSRVSELESEVAELLVEVARLRQELARVSELVAGLSNPHFSSVTNVSLSGYPGEITTGTSSEQGSGASRSTNTGAAHSADPSSSRVQTWTEREHICDEIALWVVDRTEVHLAGIVSRSLLECG